MSDFLTNGGIKEKRQEQESLQEITITNNPNY
jgi:hypothetical protein